jgi:transposase
LLHTPLISRFVDHLPYYRQETLNARSGVHTPRPTMASQSGRAGAAMPPLYDAHQHFVLSCPVLHADETPVALLDPGAGKTKRAYSWAYAPAELGAQRALVYALCLGRGSQHPIAFLGRAAGSTEVPARRSTGREPHAGVRPVRRLRRRAGSTRVPEAHGRIVRRACPAHVRRTHRHQRGGQGGDQLTRPLWKALHVWLKPEHGRALDGGEVAGATDYSLNCWTALTRHLEDGAVPIDNNFIERQIEPWAARSHRHGSAAVGQTQRTRSMGLPA